MRLVLAMVFAGLVALPLSVSAQEAGEGATSEPNVVQESAPEEPALQLKLDDAGLEVAPSPPRTAKGYTLEEMELRVKRAKIGLGVSAGVLFVGGVMVGAALYECTRHVGVQWTESPGPDRCDAVIWTGTALTVGGFVGTITSSVLLRRRKRDRDTLRTAHTGTPRRVQWDLARSRVVF